MKVSMQDAQPMTMSSFSAWFTPSRLCAIRAITSAILFVGILVCAWKLAQERTRSSKLERREARRERANSRQERRSLLHGDDVLDIYLNAEQKRRNSNKNSSSKRKALKPKHVAISEPADSEPESVAPVRRKTRKTRKTGIVSVVSPKNTFGSISRGFSGHLLEAATETEGFETETETDNESQIFNIYTAVEQKKSRRQTKARRASAELNRGRSGAETSPIAHMVAKRRSLSAEPRAASLEPVKTRKQTHKIGHMTLPLQQQIVVTPLAANVATNVAKKNFQKLNNRGFSGDNLPVMAKSPSNPVFIKKEQIGSSTIIKTHKPRTLLNKQKTSPPAKTTERSRGYYFIGTDNDDTATDIECGAAVPLLRGHEVNGSNAMTNIQHMKFDEKKHSDALLNSFHPAAHAVYNN